MGTIAKRLLSGSSTATKIMDLLAILDDLTVVVGHRDFTVDLERSILHAFDRDIHAHPPFDCIFDPFLPLSVQRDE
jgi:hypothetical protein